MTAGTPAALVCKIKRQAADSALSLPPCFLPLFSFSVVSDSEIPGTAACQASLSFTISRSLLKLLSIEFVMPSNHLILCCPLLLLPSIFLSIRVFSSELHLILCCPLLLLPSIFFSIRVFSSELAFHIRWPKYWSFSFSTSPSNVHSGLISFRMDWFDLLAVQGTLKSLLQLLVLSCLGLSFRVGEEGEEGTDTQLFFHLPPLLEWGCLHCRD